MTSAASHKAVPCTHQEQSCSGLLDLAMNGFLPCRCQALACSNDKYVLGKPIVCALHDTDPIVASCAIIPRPEALCCAVLQAVC